MNQPFYASCIILFIMIFLEKIHKGIFIASCNTDFPTLFAEQMFYSNESSNGSSKVLEWTECHVTPFNCPRRLELTNRVQSRISGEGEKTIKSSSIMARDRNEQTWLLSYSVLWLLTLYESGVEFHLTIWLFTLTRDKIGGFSHETTDNNRFWISLSEIVLNICTCVKHSAM